MQKRKRASLLFLGLEFLIITLTATATEEIEIPVGVILDRNSPLGSMALHGIRMRRHNFYSRYPHKNYTTRLRLHIWDSPNNLLTAASAARDLIYKEKVYAILGPQDSEQASYVVELGKKTQVPVIWFSTSGPSLLPPASRFFIRDIKRRCFRFKAIAAIIETFNWQSVVPIYEDPEFGNDLIPCLTYALKDMDARVHNVSAIDPHSNNSINKTIDKLKDMRTNVFLVHMTVDLGSKLMKLAQKAGMMAKGYAWIFTQELSSLTDPTFKNMTLHGALGVRPLVWDIGGRFYCNLSLYGCWAYDTVTALAKAVEKVHRVNSTFFKTNSNNQSRVDSGGIGRDDIGPNLLEAIKTRRFMGQTGVFSLIQGQEEPSAFEVYKLKEQGESIIGYWSPESGLVRSHSTGAELTGQYKLRIGVPKTYFKEFVDVNVTGQAAGFAIKVFERVNLSDYEYVPLQNKNGGLTPWPYDDEHLCSQIEKENLDAVIGDITIVASRTRCVDFTLPYLDSSVSMVVMVRQDSRNGWILFQPFHWLLWLIIGGIFVGATIIVIILERKKSNNPEDKSGSESKNKDASGSKSKKTDESGSKSKKIDEGGSKSSETKENGCKPKELIINPILIYESDIDDLKSSMSKWMVIVISFLLLIVVQVYTANLTSILTERTTAKPSSWKDVQEIKRKNRPVGYQKDSWVRDLLIDQIGFKKDHLRPLEPSDYHQELLDGRDNETEGVAAIFDETPYLMLFLSSYSSSCKIAGPIYKTGGFAFAFRKNSGWVSKFSSAILNVTQNTKTFVELKRNISLPTTIERSEYKSTVERRSLNIEDFGGFFYVVLSVVGLFFILSVLKVGFPSVIDGLVKKIKPVIVWLDQKIKYVIKWLVEKIKTVTLWSCKKIMCIFKCLREEVVRLLRSVKLV